MDIQLFLVNDKTGNIASIPQGGMNVQCDIHTMNPSMRNRLGEAMAEENLGVTPSESELVHLLSENSLHT